MTNDCRLPTADCLELAQALIRCKSVTPAEGGALTLLQSLLEPAGFTCHRMTMTEPGTPDVENLYARLGTGAPHLCFAGHTDVVPAGDEGAWTRPPFGGEVADGVLYGRGAVDMKGGVACFLAAALGYLKANGGLKRGSLSFLITGDEESVAINGTPKLLAWLKARGETLDACLVGEPASGEAVGDQIKIGRRGYVNARVVVHGKQGHSAYGERAENPIPKLARIIDRLSTTPLDTGSEHFQASSLQATIVSVPNTATNVIPGLGAGQLQHPLQRPAHARQDRGVGERALRGGGEGGGRPLLALASRARATCSSPSRARWSRPCAARSARPPAATPRSPPTAAPRTPASSRSCAPSSRSACATPRRTRWTRACRWRTSSR